MENLQEIFKIGFFEGLVWFPIVLACGLLYKYLKVIDISIDGICVLGSIVFTITYNHSGSLIISLLTTAGSCVTAYLLVSLLQQELRINNILSGIIFSLALHSLSVIWIGESLPLQYEGLLFLQQPAFLIGASLVIAIVTEWGFRTAVGIRLKVSADNPLANVKGNPRVHNLCIFGMAGLILSLGIILYTARAGQSRAGGGFEFLITALCSFLFTDRILDGVIRLINRNKMKFSYRKYFIYSIIQSPVLKAIMGSVLFQILILLIMYYTNDPAYWRLIFACILLVLVASPHIKKHRLRSNINITGQGLEVRNISLSYDNGYEKREIFSNLSFHFDRGIHIVWGPNGAGKTSLLRLIEGELTPSSGSIMLNGRDITRLSRHQRRVFYISQRPHESLSLNSAVFENVLAVQCSGVKEETYFKEGLGIVKEKLSLLFSNRSQLGVQQAGKLSGGQAQKLNFFLCTISSAQIIIADEPTSGMDTENLELFKLALAGWKERGAVIIITTHDERMRNFEATHVQLAGQKLLKIT